MTLATNQPAPPQEVTGLGQTEHDKAMLAKVDGPAATPPAKPERPEHIPEKFWDAEKGEVKVAELAKSYSELEKGRGKTQEPDPTPPAEDPAKAAEEAAKAAGADTSKLDFQAFTQEFEANGALSDATYEALAKAGLPRELVDAHIAGVQATTQIAVNEAHSLVGGAEQYDAMMDWALANLSKAEQDAFDQVVTGSPAQRAMAIQSLQTRYTAAMGSNPNLVRGGGGNTQAGAFQSRAEVVEAMRDPRYANDPAYRAQVEQKLANSSVF